MGEVEDYKKMIKILEQRCSMLENYRKSYHKLSQTVLDFYYQVFPLTMIDEREPTLALNKLKKEIKKTVGGNGDGVNPSFLKRRD